MGYIRRQYSRLRPKLTKLKKIILLLSLVSFIGSLFLVIFLRWFPVYITPLVFLRTGEYAIQGK